MMALQLDKVTGGYGDTEIIHEVSTEIKSGKILGIFGRNGVGKSTLGRLLSGEILPRSGKITLFDKDITALGCYQTYQQGVAYMPQTEPVFDALTVEENLYLSGQPESLSKYLEKFPRLTERMKQKAGTLSGGERKILAFVRIMTLPASVLILDEPSEGLQSENIEHMQNFILQHKKDGRTICLIEQNLHMLLAVSDQFIGIESGRIAYEGTKAKTKRSHILSLLHV